VTEDSAACWADRADLRTLRPRDVFDAWTSDEVNPGGWVPYHTAQGWREPRAEVESAAWGGTVRVVSSATRREPR